jgi:hypothetical protein
MEKLRFSQEDAARLNAAEYRVRSAVTRDDFTACLWALSDEFGWPALSDRCDAFEESRVAGAADAKVGLGAGGRGAFVCAPC